MGDIWERRWLPLRLQARYPGHPLLFTHSRYHPEGSSIVILYRSDIILKFSPQPCTDLIPLDQGQFNCFNSRPMAGFGVMPMPFPHPEWQTLDIIWQSLHWIFNHTLDAMLLLSLLLSSEPSSGSTITRCISFTSSVQ